MRRNNGRRSSSRIPRQFQQLLRGLRLGQLPNAEAHFDQRVHQRGDGTVVLDDVVLQKPRLPQPFLVIIVHRPLQLLAVRPVMPILRGARRGERDARSKTTCRWAPGGPANLPANGVEALDIMQRKRTDDDIQRPVRIIEVFDKAARYSIRIVGGVSRPVPA